MGLRYITVKNILPAVVTMLIFTLSACGGGGGDIITPAYITWTGSANGEYVVDATGDFVRFEANTGYMVFGSNVYTNSYVNGFNWYLNGAKWGAVVSVKATNGSTIAGLLCNNGYYADIYGPESNATITCSTMLPMVSASQDKGGEQKNAPTSESQTMINTQRTATYEELTNEFTSNAPSPSPSPARGEGSSAAPPLTGGE